MTGLTSRQTEDLPRKNKKQISSSQSLIKIFTWKENIFCFPPDSYMARTPMGFPFLIFPPVHSPASLAARELLLHASWMEKAPVCKQLSLINRLFRTGLSKRACSMYNQGATMHKIAHTHKIGIFSWCLLSFERLSDSTSLFPIQLCGQHTIRLLKELVSEIFILPNQYHSAQYKASRPPPSPGCVFIYPLKTQVHLLVL